VYYVLQLTSLLSVIKLHLNAREFKILHTNLPIKPTGFLMWKLYVKSFCVSSPSVQTTTLRINAVVAGRCKSRAVVWRRKHVQGTGSPKMLTAVGIHFNAWLKLILPVGIVVVCITHLLK